MSYQISQLFISWLGEPAWLPTQQGNGFLSVKNKRKIYVLIFAWNEWHRIEISEILSKGKIVYYFIITDAANKRSRKWWQPLADPHLSTAECSCVNWLLDFVEEARQQEGTEITALLKGSFVCNQLRLCSFPYSLLIMQMYPFEANWLMCNTS